MKRLVFVLLLILVALTALAVHAQAERAPITVATGPDVVELARLGRGLVEMVAYAPDGATIAVASSVGVWLYDSADLATASEPPLLPSASSVHAVAFSPDGALIASAEGRAVRLWDAASQMEVARIELGQDVRFLAFSPDSAALVTVGSDRNQLQITSVANPSVFTPLAGHTSAVRDAVFSPDGALIASAAEDNSVRLWSASDGSEVAVLAGHTGRVLSVAFRPDGQVLASSAADNTVRLWDVAGAEELLTLQQASSPRTFNAVAFSPDGLALAGGNANGSVYLWAADGSAELAVVETGGGEVLDLAFSPDSAALATLGRNESLKLWDVATGAETAAAVGITDRMTSLLFSPDNRFLLVGNTDRITWLWDVAAATELHLSTVFPDALSSTNNNSTQMLFFPDNTRFLTLDGFDGRIYDVATSAQLAQLSGDGLSTAAAISPDGTLVVYGGSDGVFLFDAATGDLLATLLNHTEWVKTVAFSPDQTLFATAADDGTVRVWGLPAGE